MSWLKGAPTQERGALLLRVLATVLMLVALWILIFGDKPDGYGDKIAAVKQQIAAGEKPDKLDLEEHVTAGLFYASIVNLLLGAVVFAMAPTWSQRMDRPPSPREEGSRLPAGVFWVTVLVAMALAGALRMHLAKGSLWWDELWNVKHTMSGEFRPDKNKDGELKFREASWEKGVYYYRKPTNHPPMTVASRLSLGAWRKGAGAERSEFDELATRLPSVLAGLASVLGIALLLRSWGFGAGGLVAAFLLALHPWHVRYGIEARAYSFAVLWTILACLWLGRLIRTGGDSWRYWWLFGLNQLMLVWTLPNGVYYAFAFGVAALIFAWSRPGRSRRIAMARVVVVNVIAAMGFLFLFMPNALQIAEWGKINDDQYLSVEVLQNVASQLVFGMEFAWGGGVETEGLASFTRSMAAQPVLGWVAIMALVLAFFLGLRGLLREAPRRSMLLLAVVVGAGLSMLVAWKLQQHFYHRYVVSYLVVPLVAVLGIGAVEAAGLIRLKERSAWLPVLTSLLVLGSYTAFTHNQRVVLNTRSYAPFREVAEFLGREARLQPINVIGYGLGGRVFQIYYPEGKFADTVQELDQELAVAAQRGGPVFIMFGYPELNLEAAGTAAGAAKVMDPELFEEVKAYPGIDPMFYFRVMRARGS